MLHSYARAFLSNHHVAWGSFGILCSFRDDHGKHGVPEAKQGGLRDPGSAGSGDAFPAAATRRDGIRMPQVHRYL